MLAEFKKFALRGNVLDLAIGVIIGAAFGKIVSSLVDDVIMPPIGVLLSRSHAQDFQEWCLPLDFKLGEEQFFKAMASLTYAKEHGIPTLNFGRFINNVLSFLIVAFSVFLIVRQVNRISPPVQTTRECSQCSMQIPVKARRCPQCTSEVEPVKPT